MKLNIIHLPNRKDRRLLFEKELQEQGIEDFRIWDGIIEGTPQRGISLAHKQIVRDAKEKGIPEVLIAEDDLHFTDIGAFQYFLAHKPRDFDLYLGGIYFGEILADYTVVDFSGLTLYMVHERFYDTLLSILEGFNLDRGMRGLGRFVVCDPMVVIQHSGYSDNTQQEEDYAYWLQGKKLFKAP